MPHPSMLRGNDERLHIIPSPPNQSSMLESMMVGGRAG